MAHAPRYQKCCHWSSTCLAFRTKLNITVWGGGTEKSHQGSETNLTDPGSSPCDFACNCNPIVHKSTIVYHWLIVHSVGIPMIPDELT